MTKAFPVLGVQEVVKMKHNDNNIFDIKFV